eukprot:9194625-Pyramimonas_sp.AAC.1
MNFYKLELSHGSDYAVALSLVNRSRKEGLWRSDPFMINLRGMRLNEKPVKEHDLLTLDKYQLPREGMLSLDYVQV